MLSRHPAGDYSFIKGLPPYSAGVVAAKAFAIEHVRLARSVSWKSGVDLIEKRLQAAGRPKQALCAISLRSPRPFSFTGFSDFNAGYIETLRSWNVLVDGVNPVARTNIAPEIEPPAEPSLYAFAYTVRADGAPASFVVAGAGELPEGSLDPHDVVRRGETSGAALAEKTRFVLGLMEGRLRGLGVSWDDVGVVNVYTVHDLKPLLPAEILPRLGGAKRHGVTWHYSRPPIVSIEYEMDLRGGTRESMVAP
jgi:hypothetical protein